MDESTDQQRSPIQRSVFLVARRAGSFLLRWWGYLYLLVQVGIIFLIPEHWSRSEGPLSSVVAFMAGLVPSIDRQAPFTAFPGLAETYSALIWLMTPFTLLASFGLISWNPFVRRPPGERVHLGTARWVLVMVAILLFAALLIGPLLGPALSPELLDGARRSESIARMAAQFPFWFAFMLVLNCWLWTLGFLFPVLFIKNFRRMAP